MDRIHDKLIKHKGLIIANSDRHTTLSQLLSENDVSVLCCNSISTGLNMTIGFKPHLILIEPVLKDGNVRAFEKDLAKISSAKKIPLIACPLDHEPGTMELLKEISWAAVIEGHPTSDAFSRTFKEVLVRDLTPHPFFLPVSSRDSLAKAKMNFKAQIIGKTGGNIVLHSPVAFTQGAQITIQFSKGELVSNFTATSSYDGGDGFITMFDYAHCAGAINQILAKIPAATVTVCEESDKAPKPRQILFQHPDPDLVENLRSKLIKNNISLIHVRSLSEFRSRFQEAPLQFGCLFVNQLFNTFGKEAWVSDFYKLTEKERPPLVVATTGKSPLSMGGVIFLQKPYSQSDLLHILVDQIEGKTRQYQKAIIEKNTNMGIPLAAFFQLPINLVGVDESGGVTQCEFEFRPGLARLEHESLAKLWMGKSIVRLKNTLPAPDQRGQFQTYFQCEIANSYRQKDYWNELHKVFRPQSVKQIPNREKETEALGDGELSRIFVQASLESIQHFTKRLAAIGKSRVKQRDMNSDAFIHSYIPIESEQVKGYVLFSCDQKFVSFLAHYIAGVPKDKLSFDIKKLKLTMIQFSELAFGKARFQLRINGLAIQVSVPNITLGKPLLPQVEAQSLVVPLSLKAGELKVELCINERAEIKNRAG